MPKDDLKDIELHMAYMFDCDNCGKENFVRGISPDFTQSEADAIKEKHGIDTCNQGAFVVIPNTVTCKHCNTSFRASQIHDNAV